MSYPAGTAEPGTTELRRRYHRKLEEINDKVVQLFALVGEGIAAATDALLSGDRDAARLV